MVSPLTIVLDLDSTLLFTLEKNDMDRLDLTDLNMEMVCSLNDTQYILFKDYPITLIRNDAYTFINFCLNYFDRVVVWSAGKRRYVHVLVSYLFRGFDKPFRVLTADDVSDKNSSNYYKDLSKFFDLKRTIILDDTPSIASKNKKNLLQIKKFIGIQDDELKKITKKIIDSDYINKNDVRY